VRGAGALAAGRGARRGHERGVRARASGGGVNADDAVPRREKSNGAESDETVPARGERRRARAAYSAGRARAGALVEG
jgi:hypothetical protein